MNALQTMSSFVGVDLKLWPIVYIYSLIVQTDVKLSGLSQHRGIVPVIKIQTFTQFILTSYTPWLLLFSIPSFIYSFNMQLDNNIILYTHTLSGGCTTMTRADGYIHVDLDHATNNHFHRSDSEPSLGTSLNLHASLGASVTRRRQVPFTYNWVNHNDFINYKQPHLQ